MSRTHQVGSHYRVCRFPASRDLNEAKSRFDGSMSECKLLENGAFSSSLYKTKKYFKGLQFYATGSIFFLNGNSLLACAKWWQSFPHDQFRKMKWSKWMEWISIKPKHNRCSAVLWTHCWPLHICPCRNTVVKRKALYIVIKAMVYTYVSIKWTQTKWTSTDRYKVPPGILHKIDFSFHPCRH